jgi:hypothetical protein
MANALYVDALKGYEYFYKSRGKAGIDEINRYLESHSRHPISPRTYTHYWHLLNNGFLTYLPINKFDVFASLGRLQIVADRRRYKRISISVPVMVSRNGTKWIEGVTIDKSLVGFGMETKTRFPVSELSTGWVRLDGYKDIPIAFIWRQHGQDSTRIGVRALSFIDTFRLTQDEIRKKRLTGTLRISRDNEGSIEWVSLFAILSKTDELLRAIGDLLFTLEDVLQSEITVSQPVLKSIEFSSPGSFELKLDAGVSDILKTILEFVKEIRLWGLQKRKFAAEVEEKELNNANLKIEFIRNVINLGKEIYETHISPEMVAALRKLIPALFDRKAANELFGPGSPEMGILSKRILPATADLIAGDDPEYKLEILPKNEDIENK